MRLSSKVNAYFRAQAALADTPGFWNCLNAAETLAQLLRAEGRSPWIGRLRRVETRGEAVFHAPLIPRCSGGGRAWTTHYVCVEGGLVYDPLAARPRPLRTFSRCVFGEEIPVETFVGTAELGEYLASRASGRRS